MLGTLKLRQKGLHHHENPGEKSNRVEVFDETTGNNEIPDYLTITIFFVIKADGVFNR